MNINRSGVYVRQSGDYKAFIPNLLPPEPPLLIDSEMVDILSKADRALGKLSGMAESLPNPDLFLAMYVRKEAVLSSRIEGTQASLEDILEYESVDRPKTLANDVGEVVNYVRAMNYGLRRLEELPLSLRLIREIHAELLKGVRGGQRYPGEFRISQNWIGPKGCALNNAIFVPPPVHEMKQALGDLEKYLYARFKYPLLIECGLIHYQFETIHPFLDGNGRIGRLLITFFLCQQNVLKKPLLYLSYFFKQNRLEYYERLQDIRTKGNWESWINFFLKGVAQTSEQACDTANKILTLQKQDKEKIRLKISRISKAETLLDILFDRPIVSIKDIVKLLDVTFPTANTLAKTFSKLGIFKEITGRQRNRMYAYKQYLDLLKEGTE